MTLRAIIGTPRPLDEVAAEVQRCAYAWDADACAVGNVTFGDLHALMHERIALTRERDEARAEAARLRKIFDDAGQGEHNVLALVDFYIAQSAAADERATLAYPRALQAAASVLLTQPSESEWLDEYLRDLAAQMRALTPEDIERIAEEHEHG